MVDSTVGIGSTHEPMVQRKSFPGFDPAMSHSLLAAISGMGIITCNGYPIEKCDWFPGCRSGIETHRRGGHAKTDLEIDGPSGPNLRKGDTLWG